MAIGNNADATIRINYDGSNAERGMNSLSKSLKGLATAVGGLAIMNKVNQFAKESIALAKIQIQAEAQLTSALGKRSQALIKNAAALQNMTTFGDEEIIQAESLIAAFIKEEDQIQKIIPAVLDLAAAKGMDLRTAADLVTKSLASSTNALSRYGIEITGAAGSTERIESGINALTVAFGGMAKAMANTPVGQIEQLEMRISDLKETIGVELLPVQKEWLEIQQEIVSWVTKMFQGWKNWGMLVDGIVTKLTRGVSLASTIITQMINQQKIEQDINALESTRSIILEKITKYERERTDLINNNRENSKKYSNTQREILEWQTRLSEVDNAILIVKRETTDTIGGQINATKKLTEEELKRAEAIRKAEEQRRGQEMGEQEKIYYEERRKALEQSLDGRLQLLTEDYLKRKALLEKDNIDTKNLEQNFQRETLELITSAEQEKTAKEEELLRERLEKRLEILEEIKRIELGDEEYNLQKKNDLLSQYVDEGIITIQEAERLRNAEDAKASQERIDRAKAEAQMKAKMYYDETLTALDNLSMLARADKRFSKLSKRAAQIKAIMNTATGITKTLANLGLPYAIPFMAAAAAAGGAQIAMIERQKFQTGFLGEVSRTRQRDTIPAMIGRNEAVIPGPQFAANEDAVRAIVSNTANTAAGVNRIGRGVVNNYYGLSTEQVIEINKNNNRRNITGTLI